MGKGNAGVCIGVMDAQAMNGSSKSAPEAMLDTLVQSSSQTAEQLLECPQVDTSLPHGQALHQWLTNGLSSSQAARRRYYPVINLLNEADPEWYKNDLSFSKGLELAEILFQDGAAAAQYQNTGSGPVVWTSDSAASAWGYYGLSLGDEQLTPNAQVSWAGSRRLNPDNLQAELREALRDERPGFIYALRESPSKTLAMSAAFPDGKIAPGLVADTEMERVVRLENMNRLADKARLDSDQRNLLVQAAERLPSWGEQPEASDDEAGQLIAKLQVGKSPEGYPVVSAPEGDNLACILADSWRAWVVSPQADRISEQQRKLEGAPDNWDWVERLRQTAWRSEWNSKAGKALFSRAAQGQIETRYRMLHTLFAAIPRDKMVKKAQAQSSKGPQLTFSV